MVGFPVGVIEGILLISELGFQSLFGGPEDGAYFFAALCVYVRRVSGALISKDVFDFFCEDCLSQGLVRPRAGGGWVLSGAFLFDGSAAGVA